MSNLLSAIDAAKDREVGRLLTGLGIDHVGGTVARVLARRFGSIEALAAASDEDIMQIDGIGPEIAGSVVAMVSTIPTTSSSSTSSALPGFGWKIPSTRASAAICSTA